MKLVAKNQTLQVISNFHVRAAGVICIVVGLVLLSSMYLSGSSGGLPFAITLLCLGIIIYCFNDSQMLVFDTANARVTLYQKKFLFTTFKVSSVVKLSDVAKIIYSSGKVAFINGQRNAVSLVLYDTNDKSIMTVSSYVSGLTGKKIPEQLPLHDLQEYVSPIPVEAKNS